MNHFSQIAARLEQYDLDAVLLTEEANRFYASGFHSAGTDGAALVTRRGAWYFTDSRYIEAAERYVCLLYTSRVAVRSALASPFAGTSSAAIPPSAAL